MNLVTILPLILIVGVMLMMTRSAKNKQRQALEMRSQMEPGTGVRTIGGMYAVVKEVNDETVLLELTEGVQAHFAKNAIGTVLSEGEFNRIVHGIEPEEHEDDTADAADAPAGDSEQSEAASGTEDARPDLLKKDADTHGVDAVPAALVKGEQAEKRDTSAAAASGADSK